MREPGIDIPALLDQIADVRALDDGQAIVLEDGVDALHESRQVGDVGEHVVPEHDVGACSLRRALGARRRRAEKPRNSDGIGRAFTPLNTTRALPVLPIPAGAEVTAGSPDRATASGTIAASAAIALLVIASLPSAAFLIAPRLSGRILADGPPRAVFRTHHRALAERGVSAARTEISPALLGFVPTDPAGICRVVIELSGDRSAADVVHAAHAAGAPLVELRPL